MKIHGKRTYLVLGLIILTCIGALSFLGYQHHRLSREKIDLENNFLQREKNLNYEISELRKNLSETINEKNDFEQKYINEKNRIDELNLQISFIRGMVSNFEKLSRTDPELLKKYSKIYFLNENYIPRAFVKIDSKYAYNSQKDHLFYYDVWPFLQNLLIAAESEGVDLKILSAYRSFGTQADLKAGYRTTYGSGANAFSADQGYSEHQLGTAVDFTNTKTGGNYVGFEKTETYQWLLENAHKYGFILSYPENNKYYIFEPWHWRFVSRALAKRLKDENKNFYDFEQRDIDQYLILFFE